MKAIIVFKTAYLPAIILYLFTVSIAQAAGSYSNDQIRLIFSGSEFSASTPTPCKAADPSSTTVGTIEATFKFISNQKAEYEIICDNVNGRWIETNSIHWKIEDNKICFDEKDHVLADLSPDQDRCWAVRASRFGFEAHTPYDFVAWRFSIESHPKFSTRDEIITAINNVKSASSAEDKKLKTVFQDDSEINPISSGVPSDEMLTVLNAQKETIANYERIQRDKDRMIAELQKRLKKLSLAANSIQESSKIGATELNIWLQIKDTNNASSVDQFLADFPNSRFFNDALKRKEIIENYKLVENLETGQYHALVIGINDYQHLPRLKTAIRDANVVAEVLQADYSFKVTKLINPSNENILDTLDKLREQLSYNDNLLIYYAGHGWLDDTTGRGYWLPSNAKPNRRSRWISNTAISDTLKSLESKHAIVVADSCFSGTLVRSAPAMLHSGSYWNKIATKIARVAITSGGLEPVADIGGGGHSPFAKAFIDALRGNQSVLDGSSLFQNLRRNVMVNALQTPQYSDVHNTGHDGGDFLFIRRH